MRRTDLINGAENVLAAIDRSQIFQVTEKVVESAHRNTSKEPFNVEFLTSLQNYSLEEAKLGKVERQIVSMMGLEHLAKAKTWPELLISEHSTRLYELRRDLFHLKNFLPKFLKLIEQDFVEVMKHNPNKAPSNLQGKALITVIIIEEKTAFRIRGAL